MKQHTKAGFTLVEILVVMGLISIMAVIALQSFPAVRAQARDTERKTNLKKIQTAFEQKYAVNSEYTTLGTVTDCTNSTVLSEIGPYLSGGYPTFPASSNQICRVNRYSYCACAQLENTTGNNSTVTGSPVSGTGTSPVNCSITDKNGRWFCVQSAN